MAQTFRRQGPRWRLIGAVAVVAAAFVGYTAYWLYAKEQIKASVAVWAEAQRAEGYEISYDRMRVTGFPYRFEVRMTNPSVRALAGEMWSARLNGELAANALPYDFGHWILAIDGPLTLERDAPERCALRVEMTSARLSFAAGQGGVTERLGAELDGLRVFTLDGPAPLVRAMDSLRLAMRMEEDDRLHARIQVTGLQANEESADPRLAGAFGLNTQLLRLDATVSRWSLIAGGAPVSAWSEAGGRLAITESRLEWGPARMDASGDLGLDAQLRPEGRLSLALFDPEAFASALIAGGFVAPENQDALRLAAVLAPRGEDGVAMPLRLRDGGVFLGPVRLGSTGVAGGQR